METAHPGTLLTGERPAEALGHPPLHPLLEAALGALEGAGLAWCLLRLPANPAAPSGDVDLLVGAEDVSRLRAALRPLGLVRFPGVGSGSEHIFLAYHPASDCWLRLHIVTALAFGAGYRLPSGAESACLLRRQRQGVLVMPAPEDAFWITLLHCLLDKKALAPRHRLSLQQLAAEGAPQGPLAAAVEPCCPEGWSPARLVEAVRTAQWDDLERLAPILATTWDHRQGARAVLGRLWRRIVQLPARLGHVLRRRGLSVALLGPDGAGKSTLAAGLTRSFFSEARIIYMGFGVSGGDSRPSLLARLRLPMLGAPGRLPVLWWRYLRACYHQLRGRLVLFDRYTYDALAPPPGRRGWLRRISPWIKAHACPRPDLVVVLDVPGAVMFRRKGDLSAEVLEAQRQRFLDLRQRLAGLEVVDGTQPEDAVRIDVMDRLWRLYARRWG